MNPGFFELRTAADLLAKLERDFLRLERDEMDQDAAFDFFVTAYHILDWLHPDSEDKAVHAANQQKKSDARAASALLRICADVANGAKHFRVTRGKVRAVESTDIYHGVFSREFSGDFDISTTSVMLAPEAAEALGVELGRTIDPEIDTLELARLVFRYWQRKVAADEVRE